MAVIIEEVEVVVANDPRETSAPRPPREAEELAELPRPIPGPTFPFYGVYPALVTDVEDPEGQGRVELQLPWAVDPDSGPFRTWARVATLMAGPDRGTWFIPDVDDEVLVAFEAGNPRRPYVVGAMWNGRDAPPETMDGSGRNDIRTIKSRSGVVVRFDDTDGAEKLALETPGGRRLTLEDGVGKITVEDPGGNVVVLDATGITIQANAKVQVNASQLEVNTGLVTVNAGMSRFSGVVQCDTLITNSVISSSYTPGAGNIW